MHPNLSFEQAPPISVPVRFFLTAPVFGVAAGVLIIWSGSDLTLSRWSSATLALVHLLVAGVMLQAMTGALFQFVPVAAGGNVWRPGLIAGIVHPALVLAATLLVAGLLTMTPMLLRAAAGLFLIGAGIAVGFIGFALIRSPAQGATIRSLRFAILGFAITVLLGATLAEGLSAAHPWPLVNIANLHASWGLGGWALMLLAGVSYFVVPMFQLTPPYPVRFAELLPYALLAGLVVLTGLTWQGDVEQGVWIWAWLLLVAATFGGLTLSLQQRRRRRIRDTTLVFFRISMGSLIIAAISGWTLMLWPEANLEGGAAWWFGTLALAGVFVSAINGMLYKIVPFLAWLHLQRLSGLGTAAPNMREMIPEPAMRGQMKLHMTALAALLLSAIFPPMTSVAGAIFLASNAWLGWNVMSAARNYRRFRGRIPAAGAGPELLSPDRGRQ